MRALALQLPRGVDGSYGGWLRHALTMASRAQHPQEPQGEQTVEVNLLSRARAAVEESDCLRPDGADEGEIITSLTRFDVLAGLTAIGSTGDADDHVLYPNFAQFRQSRIQPVVEELLENAEMRRILFPGTDEQLAIALRFVERYGHQVGLRYDGFESWGRTSVGDFVEQQPSAGLPRTPPGFLGSLERRRIWLRWEPKVSRRDPPLRRVPGSLAARR